jgi:hypothetical protein
MGSLAVRPAGQKLLTPAVIWNAGLGVAQLVYREARELATVENFTETLGITAQGVEIYAASPALFFSSYLPARYAVNSLVVTPADTSAFLVNFCLYPGKYNPSGYYNTSVGREFYLNYVLRAGSDVVTNFTPNRAEVVISMSALNFLVRRGDDVTLRYSL